jgi:hypothetical protein
MNTHTISTNDPARPLADSGALIQHPGQTALQTATRVVRDCRPQEVARHLSNAMRLADACVIADIECGGIPVGTDMGGLKLYDLRPMVDPREMPDTVVDMNRQAIDWALQRGLITRHTLRAGLTVRLNRHLVP